MYIILDQEYGAVICRTEESLRERLFHIKYGFSNSTIGEVRVFKAVEKEIDLLPKIKINEVKGEK